MNAKVTPWVRNLVITLGVFWLSLQIVVLFTWLFGRLSNGVIYGDGVLDAIAMGVMDSIGRAMAAALAAATVTLSATSQKPHRWAFVVAILYVVRAPTQHWHVSPTAWDRLWQSVNVLWPALVCVVVGVITAKLRRKWSDGRSKKALWILTAALISAVVSSVVWSQVIFHSKPTRRVTVEDVLKQLQTNTPVGTSRSTVESYLDSQSMSHSYIDDPKFPKERRVELAMVRDTSRSWLVRGDIVIRFRFDQSDRLLEYSAREILTGP
jgi:hypothetical protein